MSTPTYNTEKWPYVTKHAPCPICEKPDWCQVSPDGAIAGCMREKGDKYFKTTPSGKHLHHLTDAPRERPEPRPKPATAPARDVIADRAVFAIVARSCAALPPVARDELARRFGSAFDLQAAEDFGIGYVNGPALLAALADADRIQAAKNAGILWNNGTVARKLLDRLIIPHRRDGLIHDLRIAGIKALHEETKEESLTGTYAERGIAALFFNHDALGALGPDGVIHMAGGSWKTIGLVLAGLKNTVGTRGENELTAGQIEALRAAGVRTVILHIDAEDPKAGEERSPGRRLGLQKAEKLAAAGFAVKVAEPPREPGTPKVDPDALLRDLGPRAVRDYAYSAIPLDAWRVVIGEAAPGVPEQATLIARIEAELAEERHLRAQHEQQAQAEARQLRDEQQARDHEIVALRKCLQHEDQPIAGPAYGLAATVVESRARGHRFRAPHPTTHQEVDYWRLYTNQAAATGGRKEDAFRRARDRFQQAGKIQIITKQEKIETFDPQTGELRPLLVDVKYVHIEGEAENTLGIVNHLLTTPRRVNPETGAVLKQGGKREKRPTCPDHPTATTYDAISTRCGECHQALEADRLVHYDAGGNRLLHPPTPQAAGAPSDGTTPQSAALNLKDTDPQPAGWSQEPLAGVVEDEDPTPQAAGGTPVPLVDDVPAECADGDCTRRAEIGGYCASHYPEYSRYYAGDYAFAAGAD